MPDSAVLGAACKAFLLFVCWTSERGSAVEALFEVCGELGESASPSARETCTDLRAK